MVVPVHNIVTSRDVWRKNTWPHTADKAASEMARSLAATSPRNRSEKQPTDCKRWGTQHQARERIALSKSKSLDNKPTRPQPEKDLREHHTVRQTHT